MGAFVGITGDEGDVQSYPLLFALAPARQHQGLWAQYRVLKC